MPVPRGTVEGGVVGLGPSTTGAAPASAGVGGVLGICSISGSGASGTGVRGVGVSIEAMGTVVVSEGGISEAGDFAISPEGKRVSSRFFFSANDLRYAYVSLRQYVRSHLWCPSLVASVKRLLYVPGWVQVHVLQATEGCFAPIDPVAESEKLQQRGQDFSIWARAALRRGVLVSVMLILECCLFCVIREKLGCFQFIGGPCAWTTSQLSAMTRDRALSNTDTSHRHGH